MQTDAAQTDSTAAEEYVYLDMVFVSLVKVYIKVVAWVNYLQDVTKTASYKFLMGIFCSVWFFYYVDIINASHCRLMDSLRIYKEKDMILQKVLETGAHIQFINDPRLFWGVSNEYLRTHYEYVFRLMNDEFMHLKIHNDAIDIFYDSCTKIGIVIAFFPLALNTASWTNSITFSAAFLSKLASDGIIGSPFTTVLRINYWCGGLILIIHFFNTAMGIAACLVKKKWL